MCVVDVEISGEDGTYVVVKEVGCKLVDFVCVVDGGVRWSVYVAK